MPQISELYRLDQLRDSGFGRPPPRHGLNLLYWFSTECVSINNYNQIIGGLDPASYKYGFHQYKNQPDNNGIRLLPQSNRRYYIVGNLNQLGANQLPKYVRQGYTGHKDRSNADRIIVSQNLEEIYITQHSDSRNFDQRTTHRIQAPLLRQIRQKNRSHFLREMGYPDDDDNHDDDGDDFVPLLEGRSRDECRIDIEPSPPRYIPRTEQPSRNKSCCDCCTIL